MEDVAVPKLRTARILCGALMTGVVLFWAIVLFITQAGSNPLEPAFPISGVFLTVAALVAGPAAFAAALYFKIRALSFLPSTSGRSGDLPTHEDLSKIQTNLIIAWALLEGFCLFASLFFLLTGHVPLFVITVMVYVFGFGVTFPRADWFAEAEGAGMNPHAARR